MVNILKKRRICKKKPGAEWILLKIPIPYRTAIITPE